MDITSQTTSEPTVDISEIDRLSDPQTPIAEMDLDELFSESSTLQSEPLSNDVEVNAQSDLKTSLEKLYEHAQVDYELFSSYYRDGLPILPLVDGTLLITEEGLSENFEKAQKAKSDLIHAGSHNARLQVIDQDEYDQMASQAEERRSSTGASKDGDAQYAAREEFIKIVQKGYNYNASDIQLVLGHNLVVNYIVDKRIRRDLRTVKPADIGSRLISQAINTNKGGGDINYDSPQSVPLKVTVKTKKNLDKRIQLRCEKVPIEIDGASQPLGLVIRLVKTEKPETLEDMGVDTPIINAFKHALVQPKGMIVVSGPTSSGKTTLLGGSIHYFPKDLTGRTIEDPVELKLNEINENIMQMSQPKERWDEFLMSILRLAPKLILLGETRSLLQAETLISATMTGHITMTTLHTNSAIGTIDRFLDMGVPLEDLTAPDLLKLLVATRLVPKTCQSCALTFDEISSDKQKVVLNAIGEAVDTSLLRFANVDSVPCSAHSSPSSCVCNEGVKGMVGIAEFITPTEAMTNYIRQNKTVGLEQWLRERGWMSMRDVALHKVKKGYVDPFLCSAEIEGLLHKKEADPDFHDVYSYYAD